MFKVVNSGNSYNYNNSINIEVLTEHKCESLI